MYEEIKIRLNSSVACYQNAHQKVCEACKIERPVYYSIDLDKHIDLYT